MRGDIEPDRVTVHGEEPWVSDVAFIGLTIVVFAVLALVVRGVEHLVGPVAGSDRADPPDARGAGGAGGTGGVDGAGTRCARQVAR